jgi:hypothetical protein
MISHCIDHTTGVVLPPLTVAEVLPSPFKGFGGWKWHPTSVARLLRLCFVVGTSLIFKPAVRQLLAVGNTEPIADSLSTPGLQTRARHCP